MTTKYEKVEFEHPWQAAKAVCEGEELYIKDGYLVGCSEWIQVKTEACALGCHKNLYRKVKPDWWEKLDGTEENSVLAEGKVYMFSAVNFIDGLVVADDADTYATEYIKPVPSTKIEQWLKNAKEIENVD